MLTYQGRKPLKSMKSKTRSSEKLANDLKREESMV